jgi:hypothetical protein
MWLMKFIMRRLGYFRIGSGWYRTGDKVLFRTKVLGCVLATVDSKGELYVCSETTLPEDED